MGFGPWLNKNFRLSSLYDFRDIKATIFKEMIGDLRRRRQAAILTLPDDQERLCRGDNVGIEMWGKKKLLDLDSNQEPSG